MNKKLFVVGLLSAGVLFGAAGDALADGAVVGPNHLSKAARTVLVADIQKARKAKPEAFKAVDEIRGKMGALDANKRGRLAPITPMLKALGPDALLPMLERLAVSDDRGDLADTAWIAWRAGLIEASGTFRDARSVPVYVAILESGETEWYAVRAAAEALGRFGDDAAAQKLIAMSRTPGPKQKAVLAGMGDCRRKVVAEALGQALAAHPDDETAKIVVKSLGSTGNAWAWKTPAVSHTGEEAPTRAAAAQALVQAFVAYQGEVRQAASNAIMVVDDPSTPALIQAARSGASPETLAALDKLAERFARNPTR